MKTTFVLYVDGFLASNSFAYSSGTGIVSGITSAAASWPPVADLRLNSSVVSSTALMPEMSLTPLVGLLGAPTMSPK